MLAALNKAANPVIVVSGKAGAAAAQWAANLALLKKCPVLPPLTANAQGFLEMGFVDETAARRGPFILEKIPSAAPSTRWWRTRSWARRSLSLLPMPS